MAKKKIVKTDVLTLLGATKKECRAKCDLVSFAVRGLRRNQWADPADASADIEAEGERKAIDPATIAMIIELVMAMLEEKNQATSCTKNLVAHMVFKQRARRLAKAKRVRTK